MSLIFDTLSIVTNDILVLWLYDLKDLVKFDSAICNKFFRNSLLDIYCSNHFTINPYCNFNMTKQNSTLECYHHLNGLTWIANKNIKLQAVLIILSSEHTFSSYAHIYTNVCSQSTSHVMIRCEVGYDFWRVSWKKPLKFDQNSLNFQQWIKHHYESDIQPIRIADGFISEQEQKILFSKCPNIQTLTIHNVFSISKSICQQFLISLKTLKITMNFQSQQTMRKIFKYFNYIDQCNNVSSDDNKQKYGKMYYDKIQREYYRVEKDVNMLQHYDAYYQGRNYNRHKNVNAILAEDTFYGSFDTSDDDNNNDEEDYGDINHGSSGDEDDQSVCSVQHYEHQYYCNVAENICEVCPNLQEISPGVYKTMEIY